MPKKKQPKKATKKAPNVRKPNKPKQAELSDEQLEQVSGGAAVDYYLKVDGIDGESTLKETTSLSTSTITATTLTTSSFKMR